MTESTQGSSRTEVRPAVFLASLNILLSSIILLVNWASWGGLDGLLDARVETSVLLRHGAWLFFMNMTHGLAVVALVFLTHPLDRPWPQRITITTAIATVTSVPRVWYLLWDPTAPSGTTFVVLAWAGGVATCVFSVCVALMVADTRQLARREKFERLKVQLQALAEVARAEQEEIQMRRSVSDQLHGTVQHRLVVATAGLDGLTRDLEELGKGDLAARAQDIAEGLEEIRELDVRTLSQELFPTGADIGTTQAVQMLLARLPTSIKSTASLGPHLSDIADRGLAILTMAERLVIVYAVEEAVTNALKHGNARTVALHAEIEPIAPPSEPVRWLLTVTIDDDGSGLSEPAPALNGLAQHQGRLQARGGSLTLGSGPEGGARVTLTLPVYQTW